jgi:protein-S-isoprenylcysteine O-methyltransferase Ste14
MNELSWGPLALLAASWSGFAVGHSVLAGPRLERWFGRYARMAFNVTALLSITLPLGLLAYLPAHALWAEPQAVRWVLNGLMALAAIGFVHTLKYYSLAGFLGLKQETWPLTFSPWHCWVRHPWYFLMLILVWGAPMTDTWATSAVCITLYLLVGSRIEESRILRHHPGSYAAYRQIVPGLLPWKGRALDEATRLRLEAQAPAEAD